ncbi:P63C domain-containing protein [Tenacibaculum finnmarkense genomovar finnmarkense]|uniref:P63C domain-containing protein n=1 Tax=Tenacibaculum finnmarkense TaxID=2781243 RepID=UPI000C3FF877|nr:P63C domain-containing protein [Tenacibaculum finnmarkense]MCD8418845.1 P63C domain-containing protein [Tenacibaculum finnmarkense genomovar finnmarkense]MCD8440941.1 P63C domain-containing protein [Tenacibaculum finnmarkense genomovar ulcerans]MCG8187133.1 P63C domain-containing protein [Tenacibaculum finnmarkense genomovar finnmarkense]MCG8203716.1 P63C domain-containing protein [Tenacibaculum finnmarkense genomovar finnmarkense]MCG8211188.1 P63C domain-containing protein [Tenacibaculum f
MNKIIHEGEIDLAGIIIPCYVLEDGTRILSGSAMQKSLKLQEDSDNKSGTRLARYLGQKSLEPFIYKGKEPGHFDPIQCYRGEQKINGYEATVLADICESFLDARNEIKLSSRQALIAEQCEILIRGFARVGIVALVDEATGYQYDRERFELQKILNTYISEEILKWQLTFTDDFYKQIYRLWNLPFIPKYIKNKPSFIGRLTTKYIYEQLPDGVLENLRKNTPKTEKGNWKYKFHQSLTPEVGKEHLKKQITEVTTLMEISKNKKEFEDFFERKYGDNSQLELEFGEQ